MAHLEHQAQELGAIVQAHSARAEAFGPAEDAQHVEWFIECERDGQVLYLERLIYEDPTSHLELGFRSTSWSFSTKRRFAHTITGTRRAHAIAEFLRAMHPGWVVRVTTTGGI